MLCCTLAACLSACIPRPPEIPYAIAPAGPLVGALEEHRQRFGSLKALARIETEHREKRRVYESVAIVQRGFDRLRVEGYGPLGQTLFTVLWDGATIMLLPADGSGARTLGQGGLERIVGVNLAPQDLCAVLVGGAPRVPDAVGTTAGCSTDGRCIVDLPRGEERWRVHVRRGASVTGNALEIDAIERYHGGTLVFLVRYEGREGPRTGEYALSKRVIVQDPAKRASLTVEYLDAQINGLIDDGMFLPARQE